MKSVVVFAVIVASSLAMPLEDLHQWHGVKEFRQSPGYGMPSYGMPPAPPSYGGSASYGAASAGSGSAYGVFPNAKVGGCNVPLLLSCSPNVVHGKILPSYSAPSYKTADDLAMHEIGWMNQMREAHQHMLAEHPQTNVGFAPIGYQHKESHPSEKTTHNQSA